MLSLCPPFHEDNLNERADIMYASSCIHYKRSVQTSRVYGGCTTCWELVTWQSMILSFRNPHGPCWSWLTLLSIGIVYSHSLVLLCTYFGQHYMMNRYSHCLIRVFPGDEHVYKKIWFNEVSYYFQHSSGVSMLNGWSLTIVDSNSCVFESLMSWKLVADSLLE